MAPRCLVSLIVGDHNPTLGEAYCDGLLIDGEVVRSETIYEDSTAFKYTSFAYRLPGGSQLG